MAESLDGPLSTTVVWIGILVCITQSAIFSGLNLACFSVSRLRLEIEVANGNEAARKVLNLWQNSNLLLATVLWGNVAINVLLTILSNSVMLGLNSFLFSTFVITICGEILPQANCNSRPTNPPGRGNRAVQGRRAGTVRRSAPPQDNALLG